MNVRVSFMKDFGAFLDSQKMLKHKNLNVKNVMASF